MYEEKEWLSGVFAVKYRRSESNTERQLKSASVIKIQFDSSYNSVGYFLAAFLLAGL